MTNPTLPLVLSGVVLLSAAGATAQAQRIARPAPHQGTLLIEAATIWVSPERKLTDSALLVRDGKVVYVGAEIPADARKNATRLSFGKGTVVPGFVNPHCSLGHGNELVEKIDTFTPELQASDAFDPFIAAVPDSADAGVTTVGLAPSSLNAFAGQAAAVHTGRVGAVLVDSTYLKMSMIDAAFDQNRYPTSRMGAAELVRNSFKAARSPMGPPDARIKVLNDVVTGGRQLVLHVSTKAEIDAVLDLCAELSLKPILAGCEEGHKSLERIAKGAAGVMLAPLGFGSSEQRLTLPGRLEKLGVPFSFMSERADQLRIAGALAVRYGASPKTALAALTETAARHAEVSDRVGSLFEGKSADFNVFTGHPLDLTSTLTHTYIAAVRHVPEKTAARPQPKKAQ